MRRRFRLTALFLTSVHTSAARNWARAAALKSRHFRASKCAVLCAALAVALIGCDSGDQGHVVDVCEEDTFSSMLEQIQCGEPRIVVANTHGFSDVVRHGVIEADGMLRRSQFLGIPRISIKLDGPSYQSVLKLIAADIDIADASQLPTCADAPEYEVALYSKFLTRRFSLDCGLDVLDADDPRVPTQVINRAAFFREFSRLYDEMMDTSAPWVGLEYDVVSAAESYAIRDSLTLILNITNRTSSIRTVYFRTPVEFSFVVRRDHDSYRAPTGPGTCTFSTTLGYEDDCVSHSLTLAPGEVRSVTRKASIADFGFDLVPDRVTVLTIEPILGTLYDYRLFTHSCG